MRRINKNRTIRKTKDGMAGFSSEYDKLSEKFSCRGCHDFTTPLLRSFIGHKLECDDSTPDEVSRAMEELYPYAWAMLTTASPIPNTHPTKLKLTMEYVTDGQSSNITIYRSDFEAVLWYELISSTIHSGPQRDEEVSLARQDDFGYGEEERK